MKLRLSFLSLCAMLLVAGTLFTSCTQTDTPGTNTKYTDTYRDMDGLTVGQSYKFSVQGTSSSTVITGVSSYKSGIVRVFWNRGAGDTSNVTVNTSSPGSLTFIEWAPTNVSGKFRLYETFAPASVGPSGLVLGNNPHVAAVSGTEKLDIDIVLASITGIGGPEISLQSPDATGSQITNGRATAFSSARFVKGGLAMDMKSTAVSTSDVPLDPARKTAKDITLQSDSSSMIFDVRTADQPITSSHYARIEVIPQAAVTSFGTTTGHLLWGDQVDGSNSYRYVDVNVSYQPTPNTGYVARPSEIRRGTNSPRVN